MGHGPDRRTEAHKVSMGDQSVIVGNIDTGIDANHPDLAANVD